MAEYQFQGEAGQFALVINRARRVSRQASPVLILEEDRD